MEGTTDTSLITAARSGNHGAYGELFARYQSRIYNYAYGIVGNRDDAADIAQEAFVRVFEALPRLTGDLNFSAYVYRTAHNIAIDTVKGRSRFDAPEVLDVQVEPSLRADPERIAQVQEQQHHAWQAAFELSDNHRAILTLRELHDLSYEQIAEIMDMPRNTVGVLLSRARLRFKEAFRMSSVDIDKLTAECRDMLPLLSAYIDDELDDKKRTRVESHLEECAFCRLALEEMTESSRSYRAILPLLPPAALGEGIWGRLGDLVSSSQTTSSASAPASVSGVGGEVELGVEEGGNAADPGTIHTREPVSTIKSELRPKSGHRYLRPKLLASLVGGAVIVVLVILAATGTLGGRGGPVADGASIGEGSEGGPIAETVFTATTASSTSGTTLITAATISTESPAAVGSISDTGIVTTISVPAGATEDEPAADQGSEPVPPDELSTTVTEARDTIAPPTPDTIYPALGDTVQGSKITLRWTPVKDPSGVTYSVEVESFDRKTGTYVTSQSADGIKGTQLAHVVASDLERWRVAAVDGAGNKSKPSSWVKYVNPTFSAPASTSSTTTTLLLILPGPIVTISTTTSTTGLY